MGKIKKDQFYADGSAFLNKNSVHKNVFKILKIIGLTATITLFIAGSIGDQKIAKAFGDVNDNGFVSGLALFGDKLAYTMTVPFMFAGTGVLLESINKRYFSKVKVIGKVIFVVYIIFIILFILIVINLTYQQSTFDAFNGKGRDLGFGLEGTQTIIVMTLQLVINVFLMSVTAGYLRFKFSQRDDLLTKNYGIDALKIFAIFGIFGATFDPILKIIWGRPYGVHVDYQYVFDHLPKNGTKGLSPITDNAPYLNWGDIQLFHTDYWKYLFGKIEQGNHGGSDQAFPSGHMNSASLPVYAFLLYFMNEKRHQKITGGKGSIFGFFVGDVIMMAIMELITRTHYITDMMFSLTIILTFFKGVAYFIDHITYKFLSFIGMQQKKKITIEEKEIGKKTIIFIRIDNVLGTVAKVKTQKINKSNKYAYWHSNYK